MSSYAELRVGAFCLGSTRNGQANVPLAST